MPTLKELQDNVNNAKSKIAGIQKSLDEQYIQVEIYYNFLITSKTPCIPKPKILENPNGCFLHIYEYPYIFHLKQYNTILDQLNYEKSVLSTHESALKNFSESDPAGTIQKAEDNAKKENEQTFKIIILIVGGIALLTFFYVLSKKQN